MDRAAAAAILNRAQAAIANVSSDAEARAIAHQIAAEARRLRSLKMHGGELPPTPLAQAQELDGGYRARPHLVYLSDRITQAVEDVENGISRYLKVMMPPRLGKSTMLTLYTPVWCLRKFPSWDVVLLSHEGNFATTWGRQVRRIIENDPGLGVTLAPDAGAASEWETTAGGGVLARGVRGSLTGRGARLMVLDDVVKDFVDAHSEVSRQALWDWWLTVAQTRLEPPSLVIAVATRWHEDDFLGRLGADEYEGNPADWETIRLPAIADTEDDVLGRVPGEPLLSPLLDETPEQALDRWAKTKSNVGTYAWSAMYQQRPSPAKGAIFDSEWWRFWTVNPSRATDDGKIVYLDRDGLVADKRARVIESWDCAFKGTDGSDYVVGGWWARLGVRRYLLDQVRARMTFTQTLTAMKEWATDHPTVYERLVEDKANGTAVIDVLTDEVEGMIAINPTNSKEARARSVTPECEAGNVYLPHPADPGNEWVADLLAELRDFPQAIHDDQVDQLTQALSRLRDPGEGSVTVPQNPRGGNPLARPMSRTIGGRGNLTTTPFRRPK